MLIALLLAGALGLCADHDPLLSTVEIEEAHKRLERAGLLTTTGTCTDDTRDARLADALAFGVRGRSGRRSQGPFTVTVIDAAARERAVVLLREAVTSSSTPLARQQAGLLLFAQLVELGRGDAALTAAVAAYDADPTGPLSTTALGLRVWVLAKQAPVQTAKVTCAEPWTAADRRLIVDATAYLAALKAGPQDPPGRQLFGQHDLEQFAVENLIASIRASHGDVEGLQASRALGERGQGSWASFITCLPDNEQAAATDAAHKKHLWIPHAMHERLHPERVDRSQLPTSTTTACGNSFIGLSRRHVEGAVTSLQAALGGGCANEALAIEYLLTENAVQALIPDDVIPTSAELAALRARLQALHAVPALRAFVELHLAAVAWHAGDIDDVDRHLLALAADEKWRDTVVDDRDLYARPARQRASLRGTLFTPACGLFSPWEPWEVRMLTTASDVARSLPKRAANARLKLAVTYANHGDPAAVPLLRGLLLERETGNVSFHAAQILDLQLTCLAPAADHAAIRAEIAAALKR